MPTATYTVEIDWNGNGTFDGGSEDVSADVRSIHIRRGFPDVIARVAQVGRCTLVLKNDDQAYSPPLQANVLPRRLVRVRMTYSAVTTTLFYGYVDSVEPDAGTKGRRRVVIECVDGIAILQILEVLIALQENVRGDTLIGTIVSNAYTPPGTAYDVDLETFIFAGDKWSDDLVYGGGERKRALEAIRDVCASNWGWFYVRRDGYAVFENRHHRLLDQTGAATLDGTMATSKWRYRKSVESVFNEVEVTAHPRNVGGSNEVLWSLDTDNTPVVQPGQKIVYAAYFRDPNNKDFKIGGKTVVAPAATTDYTMNSADGGGGSDRTADFGVSATVYANRADIAVTNNGATVAYITKLQIRGLAVRVYAPPTFRAVDPTSQSAYQKRTLTVDAVLDDSGNFADSAKDYLLGRYKDPLDEITGVAFSGNRSAALLGYARDLEISDRVTLTESQTGTSAADFFLTAIEHIVGAGKFHSVSFDVEKAGAGGFWVLNVSQLNVDTRLAF